MPSTSPRLSKRLWLLAAMGLLLAAVASPAQAQATTAGSSNATAPQPILLEQAVQGQANTTAAVANAAELPKPISLEEAAEGPEPVFGNLVPGLSANSTDSASPTPASSAAGRRLLQSSCSTTDRSAAAVSGG
jgi:hypothetical protein